MYMYVYSIDYFRIVCKLRHQKKKQHTVQNKTSLLPAYLFKEVDDAIDLDFFLL